MRKAYIDAIGMYVPENVVTNQDLEKLMDTSDEWIRERSGIKERHHVDGECTTDLALKAAEEALEKAGMQAEDVEHIIFSTMASDYFAPGGGPMMTRRLGIPGTPALDIRMACSGFLYGLSVSKAFIESGAYNNILLITSEVQSVALDFTTRGRDTAVLFGDGAAATVIKATDEDRGLLAVKTHSDGRYAEDLMLRTPSTLDNPFLTKELLEKGYGHVVMNGRTVFKHAVTKFPQVIAEALEAAGVDKSEVKLVVPHQANLRITEAVANRLDLEMHKVVYSNIHKYGNTTSASIPIALYEAMQEGKINRGDTIVVASFGAGFTWGASVMRW
ncbi:MAG: ketoacyl-ACP synthase III [Candidatus Marinimicrobia bacterium]|jgi:3-oxoacyl-[acyl-carrier-protein] synthase-3|nr:ketoacyl-ACP synthase III [Candidatus Neomarinimicrobiota bacterium]MBT3576134.1 ketoacyl-ACP synthase III [Candidatus Neomarinimicrobiota bacterium]MBT3678758.1 ketoacyl-ACP synthase III [Candidatus Neomarinimicrobiota bacterium]MBT3951736.1 ketoacyl-ACP synthase III [Candidatus Neomarinimicrobiota bacterium]MBT4251725.1 ketoacyl-ACP synthase III [Candidatus Neomarinimicrobiota bacterium]